MRLGAWTALVVGCATLSALVAAPALADLSELERAYQGGAFDQVVALAQTEGTAPALALAARARLAEAIFASDAKTRDAAVDSAVKWGRAALKLNPDEIEAHLQLALALGLEGRRVGPVRAHFAGLGSEARGHIDTVLSREPNNFWALGMLAAWHLEIVGRGGTGLGRLFYGANRQTGLSLYNQAIVLAPDNLVLQYERAVAFVALDPIGLRAEALSGLAAALALAPQNPIEFELHQRAERLDHTIRDNDVAALAGVIVALRGGYERAEVFWPPRIMSARPN